MKNNNKTNYISDQALELFQNGYNCAQSVFSAYSKILNFDKELALNMTNGFGAGMARMQSVCGVVTGTYMVIGVYCGNKYSDLDERKENSILLIQEFNKQFLELHKSLECKTLLNCDLNTENGQDFFTKNKLKETVCEKCMKDACGIIDELIK